MFLWTKRRNNSIFCRSLIQITVIFILLFASSCDDTYDKVGGTWVIKKAIINNQEVPIYKFISNMIIFEKNGNCRVPSYDALEKDASWKIIKLKQTYYLHITAKTAIFNSKFKINLDESGNQMTISSEDNTIECTKMIGN